MATIGIQVKHSEGSNWAISPGFGLPADGELLAIDTRVVLPNWPDYVTSKDTIHLHGSREDLRALLEECLAELVRRDMADDLKTAMAATRVLVGEWVDADDPHIPDDVEARTPTQEEVEELSVAAPDASEPESLRSVQDCA